MTLQQSTTIQPALFPAEDPMITVNGTQDCVQCTRATVLLDREHVPYEYVDLAPEENQPKLAALRAAGCQQMPVIETPTERFSGFDLDRIKKAAVEVRASLASATPDLNSPSLAAR
ncbi:glutaredoxin family protein [Citricoccus sp. SGAir0253]|uniref:glutaredoxin family protein n=1 Tax=Citricoccus sp. SGAir0253 TaxID=2567881 RepID=UPI0010CD2310|nr:glutaredoxin family protein [Citricoccus sp. SGAir0253]QCU77948.1 glutaredoxin family protein [Citricoccus sp. SGAir0253]